MQRFNPVSVGDYIVLEQWCNNGINVHKEKHMIWVGLKDDEKTEEKLLEVFPVEYEDFKHQVRNWDLDPNELVISIRPSFKMCNMKIGDFTPEDEELPEPDKKVNPAKSHPNGVDKKNKMEIMPSDEKLVIDDELKAVLFDSIKNYKNMVEYMFVKYLTAEHLQNIFDNLTEYYMNADPDVDLQTFLNRAFDYDIIKQWFAEGCLTLMIKKKLPIIVDIPQPKENND